MINYYEEVDFSQTVYVADEDGKITSSELSDLVREYASETTTPYGVGPEFFVEDNSLFTWGSGGNNKRLVLDFENEQEAEHALLLSFLYDLNNSERAPTWGYSEKQVQDDLDSQ